MNSWSAAQRAGWVQGPDRPEPPRVEAYDSPSTRASQNSPATVFASRISPVLDRRDRIAPGPPLEHQALVLVRSQPAVRIGRCQIRGEVQVHQLVREAWGGVERAELPPRPGAEPGLLLELPSRRDGRVLLGAVIGHVEAAGGDLEQGIVRGQAPLADQRDAPGGVERDDRHGARVADEVTDRARSVGPLHRVDPELDERAPVEHARIDDALPKIGPGGILRGR